MAMILWKKLTETDFEAMHGHASPHGAGGGARHIALGVETATFRISSFLGNVGENDIRSLFLDQSNIVGRDLFFSSNPSRRNGEWTIRDQKTHRHPSWSSLRGFPASFDALNPPYILLVEVSGTYYARYALERSLTKIRRVSKSVNEILSEQKGITDADTRILEFLAISLANISILEQESALVVDFSPTDIEDGRRRILREIVQRQGQKRFRDTVLSAYGNKCAISHSKAIWVLEAAHIVPYLGVRTNVAQNGILLRSDIHTLFDLHLISVNPTARTIEISSKLSKTVYSKLSKKIVDEPLKAAMRPSNDALEYHYSKFVR
jgi:HNH endonuclease